MKNIFKATGTALILFAVAGCNSDTITLEDNAREEYVRNFITTFGVPDPDHNYAMAKSAGLHVTTKKGGHVTVTAEVGGKEYLFADLDVPAGTHALPVTIPASVSTLNVATGKGVHVVATDATVDIDQAPAGSRTHYNIEDMDMEDEMQFVESGDGGDPYLVFKPQSYGNFTTFVNTHFKGGEDNIVRDPDKYNWEDNTYKGSPVKYLNDNPHETGLGCTGGEYDYYIFPIYWKRNKQGNKDYQVILHKIREGVNNLPSPYDITFGDEGSASAQIPFPEIGWTTDDASYALINFHDGTYQTKVDGPIENFRFDNGSFDEAFPFEKANAADNAKCVITRGKRIHMKAPSQEYYPAFTIAVKSNFQADGSFSFVSAAPFYNSAFWGNNYFDVTLDELYMANWATKRVPFMKPNGKDGILVHIFDPELDMEYYGNGKDWWKLHNGFSSKPVYGDHYKNNSVISLEIPGEPFYLGFNSPASKPADTSVRDFSEVIFLVTRHVFYDKATRKFKYQWGVVPEPMEWTLAAEDLGGSDDWDFNDVVFTFTDVIRNLKSENHLNNVSLVTGPNSTTSVRIVTVTPKATGGTMPIYITYTGKQVQEMPEMPSDGSIMYSEASAALKAALEKAGQDGTFILGTEVHKWLGASDHTKFVNVGGSRQNVEVTPVQFVIPTTLDIGDEDRFDYASSGSKPNKPLYGFGVLVDKENVLNYDAFAADAPGFIKVDNLTMGEGTYLIGAPNDNKDVNVPQMILVQGDWQWPTERTNILDAYPNFKAWIGDHTNSDWINTPEEGKVTKK